MEDKDFIDVTNMAEDEFVTHMRELDQQSRCPCAGCKKDCNNWSQRSECEQYQEWFRRFVLNG